MLRRESRIVFIAKEHGQAFLIAPYPGFPWSVFGSTFFS